MTPDPPAAVGQTDDLHSAREAAARVTAELQAERLDPQIPARDLEPYEAGNAGIPYAFTFESGRAGPHLVVTSLAHGNEPGGLEAVVALLERGVRPERGRLSLIICNVAAYAATNGVDPYGTRFVEEDFNRVWRDDLLDEGDVSVERRRARQIRPLVAAADVLIDLHATPYEAQPFYPQRPGARGVELARSLGQPRTRFLFNQGSILSPTLANYGQFSDPGASAVAVTVECGLFFARSSADVALSTVARVLGRYELLSPGAVAELATWEDSGAERTIVVERSQPTKTGRMAFLSKPADFTAYPEGAVVAFDGDEPIRAPFDGAMAVWFKQAFVAGEQAFMWARLAEAD